jgi:nitroreductase
MPEAPIDTHSVLHALSTTRSVRRRIDFTRPVPAEVIERCIRVAVQAPTGLSQQSWRFVIVTEPELRADVAQHYRAAFDELTEERLAELRAAGAEIQDPGPTYRMLADRLQDFPALILVCSEGRPDATSLASQVSFFGSVLPAAWSLMVALRAEGIGSTWTTLLGQRDQAIGDILGIPEDATQTVLLPIGYMDRAVLRPAKRKGPEHVAYWNGWGRARE